MLIENAWYSLKDIRKVAMEEIIESKYTSKGQKYIEYASFISLTYSNHCIERIDFEHYCSKSDLITDMKKLFNTIIENLEADN